MVGLVLVSHNRALSMAAADLARGVSADTDIPIIAAGGVGDNHKELGTDATDILEAIEKVYSDDGVMILMDLGSAIISSKMAIEMLDEEKAKKVVLCSGAIVEGAVGAAVQIAAGSNMDDIKEEAINALAGKQAEIGDI
ncbi:MAG: PTS-dependent dihydroxyacetone kinase phosphotransferase subunit DhaM [Elusimicrobiota bacterium]|jgi:PTS hybrid protein|nr:PTS-dependent dihydroxyacetone kinase phosphotransferase subunit DhaM [Elusimicrobiota bacterium]